MRFSEHFNLQKTQPYLDFVDIKLNTDIPVFVDPGAIRSLKSTWGQECASLIQRYFELILELIRNDRDEDARQLVSCLNERNEFHLGYSKRRSRGRAFGTVSAKAVWAALYESKAAQSGLLKDLEDTCLLIEGIGRDMVSDAVCNIIRGPLIRYTQDVCQYHGIVTTPGVHSGPVWNADSGEWQDSLVPLPTVSDAPVILVPKILVRYKLSYDYQGYYRHYLLPAMQQDEIQAATSLVKLLKDGTPRVSKTSLMRKYGSNKLAVVEETIKRPQILEKYKNVQEVSPRPALEHDELAELEGTKEPEWAKLLRRLKVLKPGNQHATRYEHLIEDILTALFYPSLCHPIKQYRQDQGRKIVDIRYTNEAKQGFFYWLALNHPAGFIFVECKNYGKEIGNPELDQLAGRFGPTQGKVGLLVCRSIKDREKIVKTCARTARDLRGFILVLDDSDVVELVEYARNHPRSHTHEILRRKFDALVS